MVRAAVNTQEEAPHKMRKFNERLRDWGPLMATIFGTLVSIGFGVLGIYALLEAREATHEARRATREAKAANGIAYDALMATYESNEYARRGIELALQSYDQSFVAYQLAHAQFLMDEIGDCRSFMTGINEDSCKTVSVWAEKYASTVRSQYKPTSTPTISPPHTASFTSRPTNVPSTPTPLNKYYAGAAEKGDDNGDRGKIWAIIVVPVGGWIGILVMAFISLLWA
ncbi:hypothetical protein P154DRAFT_530521 [Amniculicola lignicola CBS 123094]|uniref:Uncharacterized protein n=1 Tax=Amniculicola lignicola CBS 123094 TaxID=1392246 RepID=A0A6A5WXJ8_9PLEO|nr:hypothetical protein P154DRAFT_530521 [Amniculicola lignicola CBS 123094]